MGEGYVSFNPGKGQIMVKGRCAGCQIFVVHEDIDRLILSGWQSL